MMIGVDYHSSDQYIAFADTEIGKSGERRLNHSDGGAEKFYRELKQRGVSVRVGMEATGYGRWFERLLAELGINLSRVCVPGKAREYSRSSNRGGRIVEILKADGLHSRYEPAAV